MRSPSTEALKSPALTLFELVERLSLLTRADLRQAGAGQGLHPVHLQTLLYLNEANRFSNTLCALTAFLGLTPGTVSQTVRVLARRGLLRRHADPVDGRRIQLVLTEAGQTLLKTLPAGQAWRAIVAHASPTRVSSAILVLRQILAELQTQQSRPSFGVCADCRHLERAGARARRCGLMQEKLSGADTQRICRMHAPAAPVKAGSGVEGAV